MLPAVSRVLRLAFDLPTDAARQPVPDEQEPPHIEFVAYTDDCALSGRIRLGADRLTDLLNGADAVELVDVTVRSLRTGAVGGAEDLIIPRSELFAVVAHPPRGNPARRRPTRQHAIAVGAGRYLLHGHMHTRPGSDPMLDVGRRPPMVPLTDATVRYSVDDEWFCDEAEVLLMNRERADWLRLAPEAEVARIAAEYNANELGSRRISVDRRRRPALSA
jgi:hypothetical protein